MVDECKDIIEMVAVPATRAAEEQLPSAVKMYIQAKARFAVAKEMTRMAVEQTKAQDWFDYGKTLRLGGPGAERVARAFALQAFDFKRTRTELPGGHYIYQSTGRIGYDERETLEIIGVCRSTKPLYASRGKEDVSPDKIDEGNVIKNADTDFWVNGVMRFMGLRGLTGADLEELTGGRLKAKDLQKVDFGGRAVERSEEETGQAESAWNMILEMNGQSVEKAKAQLQKLTSFTGKDGKPFTGYTDIKKVSPGVLKNLVRRVETEHKNWLKNSGEGQQFDAPAPITIESVFAEMGKKDLAGLAAYWNENSKIFQENFGGDFTLIETEKNRVKTALQQGKPANA